MRPGDDYERVVPGTPDEVRERLRRGLLEVRSLWFPTPAELRAWDRATARLSIRFVGPDAFEVAPRLHNLQAARFCPVLRGTLRDEGARTRLAGRVGYPRFTLGLVVVWAALLAVWLPLGLSATAQGETHVAWLLFWVVLAAALLLAVGLGLVAGGRALEAALPELERVASDPGAGADDWG